MRSRKFLAAVVALLASVACVVATYRLLAGAPYVTMLAALYAVGFTLGCVLGLLFGREGVVSSGVGALVATLLLWTPVVLVTYGFALIGTPLVAAFAAFIAAGAYSSANVRARCHARA